MLQTGRTTLKRLPQRGSHDAAVIHAILDEALVCHVGFVHDGQPFVMPTTYVRVGGHVYLHGAVANRMFSVMAGGAPVCVEVTLVDALVLGRSAMHHSMNYRSVVILATAHEVTDVAEKRRALEALVEHVVPGRLAEVRRPSANEVAGTRVIAVPITEASAKVRTGPPIDDEADHALPHWAGELPLKMVTGTPVPEPRLAPGIAAPPSVTGYRRRKD
jgi:uncharacterized protein